MTRGGRARGGGSGGGREAERAIEWREARGGAVGRGSGAVGRGRACGCVVREEERLEGEGRKWMEGRVSNGTS